MYASLFVTRIRVGTLIAVLGMVAAAANAEPRFDIAIDSAGQIATGVIADPPDCFGPESPLFVSIIVQNEGTMAVPVQLLTTLQPGWTIAPGSCLATAGVCELLDPLNFQWSIASLDPDAVATVRFALRVDSDTPINTGLCFGLSSQFGGNAPILNGFCPIITTNSARQCGLGAPAAGTPGLALLVGALLLAGVVMLRRRGLTALRGRSS